MFDIYMFISFVLMGLIFLRQISIYKEPNKINYSPLLLGIGAIASVIHFIIAPSSQDVMFVLKGSFIPFLIALILYIITNIMHQTQRAQRERLQHEFTLELISELNGLKEFTESLEQRMLAYAKEERKVREEFASKFNEDIQTLGELLQNQHVFASKFEELRKWHKELQELFINFTEFKLPELDGIVHKHIEMLRISNQQEFEKITSYLESTLGTKKLLVDELESLKKELRGIKGISNEIADEIVSQSGRKMQLVVDAMEKEFVSFSTNLQGLKTALSESEGKIEAIKTQSEYVIRQMVLVSKKMEKLEKEKEGLDDISAKSAYLLERIQKMEKEYAKVATTIANITLELEKIGKEYVETLEEQTQEVLQQLPYEIREIIEQLREDLNSQSNTVSQHMQLLAKQAQLQYGSGYKNDYES